MSWGWGKTTKKQKSCIEKNTQNAEWNLKSSPRLTSYTDSEWKFSKHFSSMSFFFYRKKTLSETDFLSVSILDSCIEMSQLHKLPLPQYLSMWLEFLLFLYNSYWIFPWHTLFPIFKDNTFSPTSLLATLSLLFTDMASRLICADREMQEKSTKENKYAQKKWSVSFISMQDMLDKRAASMQSVKSTQVIKLYTHLECLTS